MTRTYSREFSERFDAMLSGQVERRMKASVAMVGDMWYTCWVNAGQPDLKSLLSESLSPQVQNEEAAEQQSWLQRLLKVRPESDN